MGGCPGVLSALTLAFNTNLFGGVTHFASGQAAVYLGTKYIELPTLWKQGAYCAVLNFLIWEQSISSCPLCGSKVHTVLCSISLFGNKVYRVAHFVEARCILCCAQFPYLGNCGRNLVEDNRAILSPMLFTSEAHQQILSLN